MPLDYYLALKFFGHWPLATGQIRIGSDSDQWPVASGQWPNFFLSIR